MLTARQRVDVESFSLDVENGTMVLYDMILGETALWGGQTSLPGGMKTKRRGGSKTSNFTGGSDYRWLEHAVGS